jgi:acyl-CoA synthetase (AMP-forming)/AMP-acid ligase II/thioesterase domain-containing protein/acyl carrier protein
MPPESYPRTIKDLIFHANQNPDHPALESPGYQPLTYRDLRKQVLLVIKTLNAMGFGRNDRIAIIMPAGPETAVLGIAVMAGFTHTPLNPQYTEPEFQVILSRMKVKAIIVQKDHETAARTAALSRTIPLIEITPSPDRAGIFTIGTGMADEGNDVLFAQPEDTAIVLLTSGTTSLPKIVSLTQKQVCKSVGILCSQLRHTERDKSLHIVPHFHLLGILGTLLAPLRGGGTVICTRDFIPPDFLSLLKNERPTFYCAGPAHHQAILRELKKVPPGELKNNSLRYIRSVSAPLPAPVRQELGMLLGVPIIENYAMTESPNITINMAGKEGSVGIPIIESLVILDEDGATLGSFENGEVAIQGEVVFSGYEDAPEENASAFINGWFMTGDMGYLDDEGYLYLTGRKKELINKGGEKISPPEIDQVLMTHPAVKEAMAFRVSDPVLGEDISAMVVVEDQHADEEELRRFLLERLIPFKVPRRIFRVDEIPKGPTGKLLRYVGTERYSIVPGEDARTPGLTNDTVSPELSLYQEKLLEIWKDILDVTSLSTTDDFFRCGGNSLAAIELLIKIQRAFHLTIPPDAIYLFPTIRQQALMVAQKTKTSEQYHPLIVPIRGGGTLPPLFCFHPLGGWIVKYQDISPFFDQNRPVFGIRAKGLEPAETPPLTIQEAVREYADAIKTVQKEGPYHLLGYSAGALYAFELACQFQSRGETVIFLGIVDQSVPAPQIRLFRKVTYLLPKGQGSDTLMAAGHYLYRFFNNSLKTNPESILYSLFVKGMGVFSQGLLYVTGTPPLSASTPNVEFDFHGEKDEISTYPEEQQPLVRIQMRALQNYQPRTFFGDLTFFSTGPDAEFYPGDLTRGWNSCITGKTIIIPVPGNHETLFKEPFGHVLAKKIEESLKRVDAHV